MSVQLEIFHLISPSLISIMGITRIMGLIRSVSKLIYLERADHFTETAWFYKIRASVYEPHKTYVVYTDYSLVCQVYFLLFLQVS